jgi:quercetin dioxygenase-like cupin family protein
MYLWNVFMERLDLQNEIGEGEDIETRLLFDGPRRKIVQISLRERAVLKAHKASEPITVQCVAGAGDFIDVGKNETYKLSPGVLLTVDPGVFHEVRALPEVSILLSKFKAD